MTLQPQPAALVEVPRQRRQGTGALRAAAPHRLDHRTLLRFGVRPLLVSLDVLAVAIAGRVTHASAVQTGVLGAALVLLVLQRGLHRGRLTMSVLDDVPALTGRCVSATALTLALGVLTGSPQVASRTALAVLALLVPVQLVLRTFGYALVREVRRRRAVEHPTLVLGAGRVGGHLASLLLAHPEYGLTPVGFLDSDPLLSAGERPVPLLGGYESLSRVLVEFAVRNVVVAFGGLPESSLVDVIRTCDRLDCEVFSVPRLYEMQTTTRDMENVWGLPLVRMRQAAFRRPSWKVKRAFDVLASGFALLVLSPLMVAVALAVRLEGGPGVLFRQERVGMDERPFQVLKFRSLKPVDETESQTNWNIAHDDRLGPVGRILRTTSLDELPQLWNILRGDMTLVGPRPERPHFVDQFSRAHVRYTARHRVPAGLTGWAQVHGLRGDTSIADRARFDNYYIENWTLWGDVTILLRTVSAVVLGRGG